MACDNIHPCSLLTLLIHPPIHPIVTELGADYVGERLEYTDCRGVGVQYIRIMHLLRHEGQSEHHNIANERKGVLECLPQRQLHFLCPLFMRCLLLRTGSANGLRDNSWALIGVRDTAGVIPGDTTHNITVQYSTVQYSTDTAGVIPW